MSEAGWQTYAATAGALAITIAIYFAERAYRYKRMKENKHVGTYGFNFESK
jgi:hypothetical protein